MPVFTYDPVINPMPAYKSKHLEDIESEFQQVTDEDLDIFTMPDEIEPLLSE